MEEFRKLTIAKASKMKFVRVGGWCTVIQKPYLLVNYLNAE